MLRWTMLEKVLGVDASMSWPYLVAKPSQVEVEADMPSYPLRHPTSCGCQSREYSPWFRKVLPYLVVNLFFGEVLPLWARMFV
jgi:hypothetical protein